MNFSELSQTWKALSIMGIIFTTICLALSILLIIMFKTDLVLWPVIESFQEEEIKNEFSNFLEDFEFGKNTSSKCQIKDLSGDFINTDLLNIVLL